MRLNWKQFLQNPVIQFDRIRADRGGFDVLRRPGSVGRVQTPFDFFLNLESFDPTGPGEGDSGNMQAVFFADLNQSPLSFLNTAQRSEIGASSPWQLHSNDRFLALHSDKQVLLLQVDFDDMAGQSGFTGLADLPAGVPGNWPADTFADGLTLDGDGIDWISPDTTEGDISYPVFSALNQR